jgi:OmpA-OmpF porin, OOP family
MRSRATILILLILFGSALAGQDKGNPEYDPFWHRLFLFSGVDGGYDHLSTGDPAELSKHGIQGDAEGFLSWSWTDVTVETGGGWFYNVSSGNDAGSSVSHDKITTKAAFGRVSGRYRFTPNWEVGLTNRVLFGADTRFQTTLAQAKKVNLLLGPEAVYRFPFRFPLQLSAAFLTDVTISNRQIYQILLGAKVGFPLMPEIGTATPTPTPPPEPTATPEPTITPTPLPTPTPTVIVVKTKSYVFDLQRIEFDFDRSTLRPHSKKMLEDLGTFLAKHSDAWDKLTVEGHTDERGSFAYNQKLSERRAAAVRQELLRYGVKPESVGSAGFSYSRPRVPKSNPDAWQRNRRVEFKFEGIRNQDLLDDYFRRWNRDY